MTFCLQQLSGNEGTDVNELTGKMQNKVLWLHSALDMLSCMSHWIGIWRFSAPITNIWDRAYSCVTISFISKHVHSFELRIKKSLSQVKIPLITQGWNVPPTRGSPGICYWTVYAFPNHCALSLFSFRLHSFHFSSHFAFRTFLTKITH